MSRPKLGVVIVTYNAAPTIAACLSSLRAAPVDRLQVIVVDNASTDDTVSVVSGLLDPHEQIRLLQNPVNMGFAAGCNIGLAELEDDPEISHFWLLNPDCQVTLPSLSALFHFLEAGHGTGLTGGRVIYRGAEGLIQSDGGQIDWETGVTHGLHQGLAAESCPPPDVEMLDFVSGASLVASRSFVQQVGRLDERFFLYYEEADWAVRALPNQIAYCPGFETLHHAGASIGSGRPGAAPSALSMYFLHRSRMRLLRKTRRRAGWKAYAFGLGKAVQLALRGAGASGVEALRGTLGLGPSHRIKGALSAETLAWLKSRDHKISTPLSPFRTSASPSHTTR